MDNLIGRWIPPWPFGLAAPCCPCSRQLEAPDSCSLPADKATGNLGSRSRTSSPPTAQLSWALGVGGQGKVSTGGGLVGLAWQCSFLWVRWERGTECTQGGWELSWLQTLLFQVSATNSSSDWRMKFDKETQSQDSLEAEDSPQESPCENHPQSAK